MNKFSLHLTDNQKELTTLRKERSSLIADISTRPSARAAVIFAECIIATKML